MVGGGFGGVARQRIQETPAETKQAFVPRNLGKIASLVIVHGGP